MSVSFYIKNKKKFFGYEKILTVREAIDLFKEYKLFFLKSFYKFYKFINIFFFCCPRSYKS